jgi:hypothetical protein
MTADELATVMRRSGYTRDDLAAMYNRDPREVDDWLEGRSRVPRSVSIDLGEVGASLAAGAEVERQMAASGLGKCQWLAQFSEENPISLSQFQEHAKACAICGERERLARALAPKRAGFWSRLRRWVGL